MTWSVLQGHLVAKALSLAFSWAGTYGPSLVSNLASKAGSSHAAVRARVTNMLQRMDEQKGQGSTCLGWQRGFRTWIQNSGGRIPGALP